MVTSYVWIGIIIGVFFAGLAIGYTLFTNTYSTYMMTSPQSTNALMNHMVSNPQDLDVWTSTLTQNPQFMNQFMSTLMQNTEFQQQYMGPWMMVQDPRFMQGMMEQWSIQQKSENTYAHPIVKTDRVSIVSGAWKYNTTESYSPTIIQIITGTTITWRNDDSVVHTVTDLTGKFDSHLIQPNSSWKYTFYYEGKYNYFCTLHPWMKGLIIVT